MMMNAFDMVVGMDFVGMDEAAIMAWLDERADVLTYDVDGFDEEEYRWIEMSDGSEYPSEVYSIRLHNGVCDEADFEDGFED